MSLWSVPGTPYTDNGVAHVAHTALEREEASGDTPGGDLIEQEPGDMRGDGAAHVIDRRERPAAIGLFIENDADHLRRVNPSVRLANLVQRVLDRDRLAMRRQREHQDVGHLPQSP